MSGKTYSLDLVFLFLSISLISGCYTVVMHQKNMSPSSEGEAFSEPEKFSHSIDISNHNSCTSCHSNNLDYDEFGTAGCVFGSFSMWAYYYDTNIPWWVSRGRNDESAEDDSAELGDTGMRRFYGRRREALNNDNASSSITTTTEVNGGGAVIPSFFISTPTFGGTVTTTISGDSVKTQNTDTMQTVQTVEKVQLQNVKRDFGVRKSAKKK